MKSRVEFIFFQKSGLRANKPNLRQKLDAYRGADLDDLTGWRQTPGLKINPKDTQIMGALVCHNQKATGWIDGKTAWGLALSRLDPHQFQHTILAINEIRSKTVMAS